MRLLISSSTLDIKNGYGNITYELVRALRMRGHEITLLLPQDDPYTKHDVPGVRVERVLPPYVFSYKHATTLRYAAWRYAAREPYDLVWSLFEFPYAPIMCREAKRMGIPFVMGAQGTYGVEPLTRWPERLALMYAYRSARSIIVPSEYTKRAILKEAREPLGITVIHNGVDFARFDGYVPSGSTLPDIPADALVLLTVGSLKKRKGQDLVIRALPKILARYPDALYVMVGYPDAKEEYESLARGLGVDARIRIPGAAEGDTLLEYFHRCAVYVHTPRVHDFHFEGFGIVYLEAGACSKPSVATDAGGIRDAVVDGETGLIAEDEDADGVASRIIELLGDEERRVRMGKAAREYARAHNWALIADAYERVLLESLRS